MEVTFSNGKTIVGAPWPLPEYVLIGGKRQRIGETTLVPVGGRTIVMAELPDLKQEEEKPEVKADAPKRSDKNVAPKRRRRNKGRTVPKVRSDEK